MESTEWTIEGIGEFGPYEAKCGADLLENLPVVRKRSVHGTFHVSSDASPIRLFIMAVLT